MTGCRHRWQVPSNTSEIGAAQALAMVCLVCEPWDLAGAVKDVACFCHAAGLYRHCAASPNTLHASEQQRVGGLIQHDGCSIVLRQTCIPLACC